jgi:alkylation response protein AidB-like acyl-CoA dehydrogenase
LGVARKALDTLVAMQQRRGGSATAGRETLQRSLAHADLRLRAARALVRDVFAQAWSAVCTGAAPSPSRQSEMRAVAAFATEAALDTTALAFRAGGAGAVFRSAPLQRCLCDMQTAAQHWLVRDSALATYGQFLLGIPDANPLADAP